MKFVDLEKKLQNLADLNYAEAWDNSGVQVIKKDSEIKKVLIALDCTSEVIDEAISFGADLILTHHPLIFSPLKKITSDDYLTGRIYKLIENGIGLYSMHTNFDVCCMRNLLDERVGIRDIEPLEKSEIDSNEGIGSVGNLEREITLKELSQKVMEKFELSSVKFFGDEGTLVRRVGVLGGSGKSEIDLAVKNGCDVYITGDIDHHSGIDAVEKGICVIDAGHYGLEHVFTEYMYDFFKENLKEIEVRVESKKEPFSVYTK